MRVTSATYEAFLVKMVLLTWFHCGLDSIRLLLEMTDFFV